jgi:hypothetical protein
MIYDIYLLTASGLPPSGSCTVHIYTQTIHSTTQNKQYIVQHKIWEQYKNLGIGSPTIEISDSRKWHPSQSPKDKGHRPTVMHVVRCKTGVQLPRQLWFCSHQLSLRKDVLPSVVQMKTSEQPGLLLALTHAYRDQCWSNLGCTVALPTTVSLYVITSFVYVST